MIFNFRRTGRKYSHLFTFRTLPTLRTTDLPTSGEGHIQPGNGGHAQRQNETRDQALLALWTLPGLKKIVEMADYTMRIKLARSERENIL